MTSKKILLFTFFMSIASCVSAELEKKKFDAVCALFQDVIKLDLESQARLAYIDKHFDSIVDSKDIKEAYELVFQVSPDRRYQAFKHAVESDLGQTWECPALNNFFK